MIMTLKQLSGGRRGADHPSVPMAGGGPGELLRQLDSWVHRGWLRELDRAFAAFLLEQDARAQALVLLAAALTSHQLGRGHSCLDLDATLQAPDLALSLPPEGGAGDPLPSQWLAGLDADRWRRALASSAMVEDRDAEPRFPERPLVLQGRRLYLRRYWNYERGIAEALGRRLRAEAAAPENLAGRLDALFPQAFEIDGKRCTDWQKVACALAARGNFSIVTGGPGTGKTTSVVRLLGLLQIPAVQAGAPLRIRLAAPTGKAAARLSESIGRAVSQLPVEAAVRAAVPTEVSTLHQLLGSRPGSRNFFHGRNRPLELDVLVVDEASMIDLEMMACLLEALPRQARLILLGDKDQLASVDAGSVLGDLCRDAEAGEYSRQTVAWLQAHSGETLEAPGLRTAAGPGDPLAQQTVMLRHSRRFDAGNGIGRLARLVNGQDARQARALLGQGVPQLFDLDLRGGRDAALTELIVDGAGDAPGYRHYLEQMHGLRPAKGAAWDDEAWPAWAGRVLAAFDEFRLLCALRRGPWGVEGLNQRAAVELRRRDLLAGDRDWYEGRPVLVTRNDYGLDLMNGDIGIALRVPDQAGGTALRVAFARNDGSGGVRFVMPSRLTEVETVFAMTVHKSQGSEFNHTALVLPDAWSPVLTKELLYTAITRAKRRFSLVEAAPGVFEEAVARNVQRTSGLALQLQDELARAAP